ncbi:MAG: TIGR04255 family protein [Syntrophales bacterium]
MKAYTAFSKAPIVEAVLDIQVEPVEGMNMEQIGTFFDHVKGRYPEKELRAKGSAVIRISPQGTSADEPAMQPVGYLYRSPEEKKAVQARIDGYTFNKFSPYENWGAFSDEAREHWQQYVETAKPNRLKRLALRYINRIEIPLPIRDFKEYLLTMPEIAPGLPQALAHFIMRLVVPNPEIEATAVINVVMDQSSNAKILPIIFDIDVFKITNHAVTSEEIWHDFDQLRVFKNEIFFNSITDKAKGLFQ